MSTFKRRRVSLIAVLVGGLLTVPAVFAAPATLYKVSAGVFSLGTADKAASQIALDNPDVAGMSIRQGWASLEPTEGNFNFSFLDSEVARAASAGKKVILRIGTQIGKPEWVTTAIKNARGTFFTFDDDGVATTIPVFWDPTFLAKKKAMIAALGNHFANNPNVVIVAASFANATSEDWNVPHKPDEVPNWVAVGYTSDKLVDAGKQIIDATMAAFPNQRIALAISGNGPSLDPDAHYVVDTVIAYANTAWPRRLIPQINSVGTFNPAAPPASNTTWYRLWTNQPRVAGQMVFACNGDDAFRCTQGTGNDPALALTQSVDAAASYGLRYLEIYQGDVIALPEVITYAAGKLGKKK